MRATEAQYQAVNDDFRRIMRQYGDQGSNYNDPSDFASFWNSEIDPNELRDRFEIYDAVRNASDVKDAFYVYAGLSVSDDQLYEAVVNPDSQGARLAREYNQAVAASPLDYNTFITRASERALAGVVSTLERLSEQGVATGAAIEQVRSVDPEFGRNMADLLYHGGTPSDTATNLSLAQLTRAYEYSLIGSAARAQGFELPTGTRLEQLRLAGVDRARALEGYGQFAQNQNQIRAMVNRFRGADVGFGVEDFERAVFLNSAEESELLARAASLEASFGRQTGSAALSQQGGRVVQRGLGVA